MEMLFYFLVVLMGMFLLTIKVTLSKHQIFSSFATIICRLGSLFCMIYSGVKILKLLEVYF